MKYPMTRVGLLLLSLSLSAQGCSKSDHAPQLNDPKITTPKIVRLFAAAGARAPSDEICDEYEKETGNRVERNYASSGTLARQIAAGAPWDVFISANREWVDFLEIKHLLKEEGVKSVAGNSLVLVAPKDSPVTAPEFLSDYDIRAAIKDKIAVGDPASVPVGKYTKEVFDKLGWWEKVQDKIVMAKDVSSVLHYTELGECDFGIVYRSEAVQSSKVAVIKEVPSDLHSPITFFASSLLPTSLEAKALFERFVNSTGSAVFLKHGFVPLKSGGK